MAPRWTSWEDVEPTGWEEIDEVEVTADRQERLLSAVELPATAAALLGDYVHPSVLAQVVGGSVLRYFDPPRPPHRLLARQYSKSEGPVRIGERLRLIGRLSEKVGSGDKQGLSFEGWALGADGTPRFFHRQKIRVIDVQQVARR